MIHCDDAIHNCFYLSLYRDSKENLNLRSELWFINVVWLNVVDVKWSDDVLVRDRPIDWWLLPPLQS